MKKIMHLQTLLLLSISYFNFACNAFRNFGNEKAQRVTTITANNFALFAATPWGGELAYEAGQAAKLVCAAVRLCRRVQEDLVISKGDKSLGTKVSASAASSSDVADIKIDGTPVTAADFVIQGFVASRLKDLFPDDRFMGEEDATGLRADDGLIQSCMVMLQQLVEEGDNEIMLDQDSFLNAIDYGVEEPRGKGERVWILDPIDGTKGLITGKQYIVGLALTDPAGNVIVSVMGNPNPSDDGPEVMVAVKGFGLRYWSATIGEKKCIDLPRDNILNRHMNEYNFTTFSSDDISDNDIGWGLGTNDCNPTLAGVDYPPYLLSRPMTVGSPLPFGPMCAPSEMCCGSQVKYFAVAKGEVAGFIQFQDKLKSWDHAPGLLCVQESGGTAFDAERNDVLFNDREVTVSKGVICCAAEAVNSVIQQRLIQCVQQSNIDA